MAIATAKPVPKRLKAQLDLAWVLRTRKQGLGGNGLEAGFIPSEPVMSPFFDHFRSGGRYRFRLGRSLDPHEELHPEMVDQGVEVGGDVPGTIDELIAMQQKNDGKDNDARPEKGDKVTEKVRQVLDCIEKLDTSAAEDQEIALAIVRHLEKFHDDAVKDMVEDRDSKRSQLAAWAVDADRLMYCRFLLESIDL